ncbi:MAG: hypothetical protein WCX22_12020 [Methanoregula sp.]
MGRAEPVVSWCFNARASADCALYWRSYLCMLDAPSGPILLMLEYIALTLLPVGYACGFLHLARDF